MAWRQGKDSTTQEPESRRVAPRPSLPPSLSVGPYASVRASSAPLMLCVNKDTTSLSCF